MGYLVVPGEKLLTLPGGESITVKRKLNAGETFDLMAASEARLDVDGRTPIIDPNKASMALVLTYLLSWTLTDDGGGAIELPRPIPGDDDNYRARLSAIRSIEFDALTDILQAITAHDTALRSKKRVTPNAPGSPEISALPAVAAGATNG